MPVGHLLSARGPSRKGGPRPPKSTKRAGNIKADRGFTLVEMSIAMTLLSLVLIAAFHLLVLMVTMESQSQASVGVSNLVGLTQLELDQSIREGEIYQYTTNGTTWVFPSTCTTACAAATGVIVLEQTNGAGGQECVEWEITGTQLALGRLSWAEGGARATGSPQAVVHLTAGSFSVPYPSSSGLPALKYSLTIANPPSTGTTAVPVTLSDTVAALNGAGPNGAPGTC